MGRQLGMDCLAVEELKEDVPEARLREALKKAHQNLGHPGRERFATMLKAAGSSARALELVREFRCGVCEARQGLKSQKVSKVKATYDFNQGVVADTVEVKAGTHRLHASSLVCEGTIVSCGGASRGGNRASETRRAYRRHWKAMFGAPRRLHTDGGSEFEKEFQEGLFLDGTSDERSAGYAPWQNGLAARHGQTWKHMFEKVVASMHPSSPDEIDEIADQVSVAKNSLVNRSGFSPFQRVLGTQIRLPGLLYSGESHEGVNSGIVHGDPAFVRANELRRAARKAFWEADNEETSVGASDPS